MTAAIEIASSGECRASFVFGAVTPRVPSLRPAVRA